MTTLEADSPRPSPSSLLVSPVPCHILRTALQYYRLCALSLSLARMRRPSRVAGLFSHALFVSRGAARTLYWHARREVRMAFSEACSSTLERERAGPTRCPTPALAAPALSRFLSSLTSSLRAAPVPSEYTLRGAPPTLRRASHSPSPPHPAVPSSPTWPRTSTAWRRRRARIDSLKIRLQAVRLLARRQLRLSSCAASSTRATRCSRCSEGAETVRPLLTPSPPLSAISDRLYAHRQARSSLSEGRGRPHRQALADQHLFGRLAQLLALLRRSTSTLLPHPVAHARPVASRQVLVAAPLPQDVPEPPRWVRERRQPRLGGRAELRGPQQARSDRSSRPRVHEGAQGVVEPACTRCVSSFRTSLASARRSCPDSALADSQIPHPDDVVCVFVIDLSLDRSRYARRGEQQEPGVSSPEGGSERRAAAFVEQGPSVEEPSRAQGRR